MNINVCVPCVVVQGTVEVVKLDGEKSDSSRRTVLHSGGRRGVAMEDLRAVAVDPTQR